MKQFVPTNLTIDAKKFVGAVADEIIASVKYAYPGTNNSFDSYRAQTSLQSIQSSARNLNSFLQAINEVEVRYVAPPPDPSPEAVYLIMDQKGKAVFEGTCHQFEANPLVGILEERSVTEESLRELVRGKGFDLYRKLS